MTKSEMKSMNALLTNVVEKSGQIKEMAFMHRVV